MSRPRRESSADYARSLARAFAGALLFGLPLLMTMEMWWLGFYMEPWRLALFLVLFFPFLVLLSWHAGFEETFSWKDDVLDALVALAVAFVSAAAVLGVLGILERRMSLHDAVGPLALQVVPASIGALLAQAQLGERDAVDREKARGGAGYASEIFIMSVGALFLAFNLAPTDEMLLIALRLTEWHTLVLMAVSLGVMHAFVYSVAFHGQPRDREHASEWSLFMRFTVVGYVLALLLSAYILWSFGRLDGLSLLVAIKTVTVLGFPATVGAAAGRLIL